MLRSVTVVGVTSRIRGLPTEVPLGKEQGLARDCVTNCDNLFTLEKRVLGAYRGSLGFDEARRSIARSPSLSTWTDPGQAL